MSSSEREELGGVLFISYEMGPEFKYQDKNIIVVILNYSDAIKPLIEGVANVSLSLCLYGPCDTVRLNNGVLGEFNY